MALDAVPSNVVIHNLLLLPLVVGGGGVFVVVALHPKSTAMVMAGRLVHLTTLFPGQA